MFWRLTPREFAAWTRGRVKAHRHDLAIAISSAWHSAAFMFVRTPGKGKLPPLARIIGDITNGTGRKRDQTPEETLAVVLGLNKKFGGRDMRGRGKGG